jgi:hypothetical protein
MKTLCPILIVVLALHSFCGAKCLSADVDTTRHSDPPPVHKPTCHDEAPDDSTHDDTNKPCGGAQALEAKIERLENCAAHDVPAVFAATTMRAGLPQLRNTPLTVFGDTPTLLHRSTLALVLRI